MGRVKNSLQFFGHSGRTTLRIPPKFRAQVLWGLGYLALNCGGTFSPGRDMRTSILWKVGWENTGENIFLPPKKKKIAFSFSAIAGEPLNECRPNFTHTCFGPWGTWRYILVGSAWVGPEQWRPEVWSRPRPDLGICAAAGNHTFSAFWLRSSVVSVLISLISGTWRTAPQEFKWVV